MTNPEEFAPEYSKKEKIRYLAKYLFVGLAVIALSEYWLFPAINNFAANSPCLEYFGMNGFVLLWYALFVGIPLASALFLWSLVGRRALRILRGGQVPAKGEKVFRATKIIRGSKAKYTAYALLVYPLIFVAIAVWGYTQAVTFTNNHKPNTEHCSANVQSET